MRLMSVRSSSVYSRFEARGFRSTRPYAAVTVPRALRYKAPREKQGETDASPTIKPYARGVRIVQVIKKRRIVKSLGTP